MNCLFILLSIYLCSPSLTTHSSFSIFPDHLVQLFSPPLTTFSYPFIVCNSIFISSSLFLLPLLACPSFLPYFQSSFSLNYLIFLVHFTHTGAFPHHSPASISPDHLFSYLSSLVLFLLFFLFLLISCSAILPAFQ